MREYGVRTCSEECGMLVVAPSYDMRYRGVMWTHMENPVGAELRYCPFCGTRVGVERRENGSISWREAMVPASNVAFAQGVERRAEQALALMAGTQSEEFVGHLQDGFREQSVNSYWADGASDMLLWVAGRTRPGRWFRWLLDRAGIAPDPQVPGVQAMVPRAALEWLAKQMPDCPAALDWRDAEGNVVCFAGEDGEDCPEPDEWFRCFVQAALKAAEEATQSE